jgi:septal ring factor EnvC (AmiA/AmiB activator)
MPGSMFAGISRLFQGNPDWYQMYTVPRRVLSLVFVTITSGVSSVIAAVEDAHPVSMGAGIVSLAALGLNAYVIYKSNREKSLESNQEAMRKTLHGIRNDLNRRNLENEVLRQNFIRVTEQLAESNKSNDQLRKELQEANRRLAKLEAGVDHLNKGMDDALAKGSHSGD